jgi:hypothetical protein
MCSPSRWTRPARRPARPPEAPTGPGRAIAPWGCFRRSSPLRTGSSIIRPTRAGSTGTSPVVGMPGRVAGAWTDGRADLAVRRAPSPRARRRPRDRRHPGGTECHGGSGPGRHRPADDPDPSDDPGEPGGHPLGSGQLLGHEYLYDRQLVRLLPERKPGCLHRGRRLLGRTLGVPQQRAAGLLVRVDRNRRAAKLGSDPGRDRAGLVLVDRGGAVRGRLLRLVGDPPRPGDPDHHNAHYPR